MSTPSKVDEEGSTDDHFSLTETNAYKGPSKKERPNAKNISKQKVSKKDPVKIREPTSLLGRLRAKRSSLSTAIQQLREKLSTSRQRLQRSSSITSRKLKTGINRLKDSIVSLVSSRTSVLSSKSASNHTIELTKKRDSLLPPNKRYSTTSFKPVGRDSLHSAHSITSAYKSIGLLDARNMDNVER